MRPNVSKQSSLVALASLGLCVPAFFVQAAQPPGRFQNVASTAHASALQEMAASGDLVESWGDYALSSLKSNFAWARETGETLAEPPTIFNRARSSWARTPVSRFPGTSVGDVKALQVVAQSSRVSESPIHAAATDAGSLLPDQMPGLRRTIVAPSFTHRLDDNQYWRLSLILAYQKFNLFTPPTQDAVQGAFDKSSDAWSGPSALRYKENSVGFGARLDVGGRLVEGLDWRGGYQSRVSMDNFYTYRGIFGQAGSFDIPPGMNFGVDWTPARNIRLSADAERVMYSQIAPFANYSLPADFQYFIEMTRRPLAWENLNIYSVAAAWNVGGLGEISMRYSTREQPFPTLGVLQQLLLKHDISSRDWELGYAKAFAGGSVFRFRALYAPIQLLGIPNYTADSGYGMNRMRYEALLTTTF